MGPPITANGSVLTRCRQQLQHNLGHFLKEAGDLTRAETVLRDAWLGRKKLLGAGDLETLKTHFTLGEVLLAAGERAGALGIYRDVVALARQSLEPSHPFFAFFHEALTALENGGLDP